MIRMITGFDMFKLWFMGFVVGGTFLGFGYLVASWIVEEKEESG